MFIDTLDMPREAKLLPWLAVGIGGPVWLLRVENLFRWNRVTSSESEEIIMDTGFLTGEDPKVELLGVMPAARTLTRTWFWAFQPMISRAWFCGGAEGGAGFGRIAPRLLLMASTLSMPLDPRAAAPTPARRHRL